MCISELLRALCARKIHNNYDDMNYSKLIAAIDDRIRANGRREITGQTLHDVLEAMVRSLGAGYQVAGVLGPDDDPGEPDQRFAWLASEAGVYRHCGGVSVTELSWLVWGGGQWLVKPLDVPFGASVREWITDAVAEERSRALIAEALLQKGIDKEVADRTEAVAAEARERKAADAEEKAAREKAVADEQARAESAEQANAAAIAKETEDREAAVAAEAKARTDADAALGERVDTEIADRKAAVTAEETERKSADAALDGRVTAVEAKIPAQASAENQLADKAFVNSSISTATATFRGTFESLEALKAAEADKNDYAFWAHKDEAGNTCYDKYAYDGAEWRFEYRQNNSSFTAAQWAALNSGVTADVIKALQEADKANAKAIADEKAERIAAVKAEQAAREQADTANANAIATEVTERKAADATLQDNIDKKQDALDSGTNIKTVNGESLLGSGDLVIHEGLPTIKAGEGQFSEIFNFSDSPYNPTRARGTKSHAEGTGTFAGGASSHAEGSNTTAGGEACHAEGELSQCGGTASHAEGYNNKSLDYDSDDSFANRQGIHIEGAHNTVHVNRDGAHIEGAFHKGIKGRGLAYTNGCHIGGSCYLDQRFGAGTDNYAVINRIIGAGTDEIPKNAFALVARNYSGHSGSNEPTSLFYFQGIGGYTGKEDNVGDDIKDLATVISELESAGGGPFAMTLTLGTGDKWSMDCTFAELAAAVDAKRGVIFTMSGGSYDGNVFTATLLKHISEANMVILQGYVNKAFVYVAVTNGTTGLTVDVSDVNLVDIDATIPAAPSNENVPGTKAVKDYVDKYAPCVIRVDEFLKSGLSVPYAIKSGELSPDRVIVLQANKSSGIGRYNVFGFQNDGGVTCHGYVVSSTNGEMVQLVFDMPNQTLTPSGNI